MDLVSQGETSGGLSIVPAKRRRGRPPKDPSLKHTQAAKVFHGFGAKHHIPPTAGASTGQECEVGQTVTGVVEAAFDAGYLLRVRIGNSNTNLRGVVFKPGHCVPITAENDVAPHVPMIRRKDVQTPGTVPPGKRKYTPRRTAAPVPPTGPNGNFTPVILQPGIPVGMPNPEHVDEDVHMVEPLSMVPPDQSMSAAQIFMSAQGHLNRQVAPGNELQEDGLMNEATSEEKSKALTLTDTDTPGSSQTSDTKTDDGKETAKSSPEDSSGIVSKQELGNTNNLFSTESLQSAPVMKPLFNYGTGRMTELLQAVQENMKDPTVQFAEQPPPFAVGVNQVPHDSSTNQPPPIAAGVDQGPHDSNTNQPPPFAAGVNQVPSHDSNTNPSTNI